MATPFAPRRYLRRADAAQYVRENWGILLTGARDDSTASMRLKHLDFVERVVFHDPREVRVKFSRSFPTYFFPVGGQVESIVADWVAHLRSGLGFLPDDPLFPPTKTGVGPDGGFAPTGFERKCWAGTSSIRAIFKAAFATAGLPYFHPHSFRKTLVRLGMEVCATAEAFKAWSQYLGHEEVLTTFRSYGSIPAHRQRDLIRASARSDADERLIRILGEAALGAMKATKDS